MSEASINSLGKSYDPKDNMIRWDPGPIKGMEGYSLRRDGAVVKTTPRVLKKKERRKNKLAQETHEFGYNFRCGGCDAVTFHFLSCVKVKVEGYENKQEAETYECSVCGTHFDRNKIDEIVAKSMHKRQKITKAHP